MTPASGSRRVSCWVSLQVNAEVLLNWEYITCRGIKKCCITLCLSHGSLMEVTVISISSSSTWLVIYSNWCLIQPHHPLRYHVMPWWWEGRKLTLNKNCSFKTENVTLNIMIRGCVQDDAGLEEPLLFKETQRNTIITEMKCNLPSTHGNKDICKVYNR